MSVDQARGLQRRNKVINYVFFDVEYAGRIVAVSESEVCIEDQRPQWFPLHFVSVI